MIVPDLARMMETITSPENYRSRPPSGPPIEYPVLTDEDLEAVSRTVYGQNLAMNNFAYHSLKLFEDSPEPKFVPLPSANSLDGKYIWGIDGSNERLDYTSFHILICRAAIVEYLYSKSKKPIHHSIETIDCGGVCLVDGNIFDHTIQLFGQSTNNVANNDETSWIDIIEDSNDPLIVRFDPRVENKSPSSHAFAWAMKFMTTLEYMALTKIPDHKSGVVIRDGPLFSTGANNNDTYKAIFNAASWKNKILIGSSKRVEESTLYVELLRNPENHTMLEFYFPDQNVTRSQLDKLPADHILLPRILEPGQRTPLIETIPQYKRKIPEKFPGLTPICCYYMRRRKPHSIIRIEIPKVYLLINRSMVDWAISCAAWQHELGTQVPHIQEMADMHCNLRKEASLLRKITGSELFRRGLDTLEVYQ